MYEMNSGVHIVEIDSELKALVYYTYQSKASTSHGLQVKSIAICHLSDNIVIASSSLFDEAPLIM